MTSLVVCCTAGADAQPGPRVGWTVFLYPESDATRTASYAPRRPKQRPVPVRRHRRRPLYRRHRTHLRSVQRDQHRRRNRSTKPDSDRSADRGRPMTSTPGSRYFDNVRPSVDVEPVLRTAGSPAHVVAVLTNRAAEPRILAVTCARRRCRWLPAATRSGTSCPRVGSVHVTLTFVPSLGTLPGPVSAARSPSRRSTRHTGRRDVAAPRLADVRCIVDAPGQIDVSIAPDDAGLALFRRKYQVPVRNTGPVPETVRLEADTPRSPERLRSARRGVHRSGRRGRGCVARVRCRPRWFGHGHGSPITVIASGGGAAARGGDHQPGVPRRERAEGLRPARARRAAGPGSRSSSSQGCPQRSSTTRESSEQVPPPSARPEQGSEQGQGRRLRRLGRLRRRQRRVGRELWRRLR